MGSDIVGYVLAGVFIIGFLIHVLLAALRLLKAATKE